MMGIGGIGMSALARYFLYKKIEVLGYDKTQSKITNELQREGAKLVFNEDFDFLYDNISDTSNTLFIKTPAVPDDHPYFQWIESRGETFMKRSEVLGLISKDTRCLGVAGTHGKTTISSMLANVMKVSEQPMVAFLGGITKDFNSNFYNREGQNQWMVVEADEYDRSFLALEPEIALISNVDPDHLDIYGSEEGVIAGFNEFANRVKGELIVNHRFSHLIERDHICYGKEGDYTYSVVDDNITFYNKGEVFNIELNIGGVHNIENALAAFSVACEAGVNPSIVKEGIKDFKGIGRRFDYLINSESCIYIDDYAHHPFEINALISSVRNLYPGKKVVGAFQPHLFSRTNDFVDGFRKELSNLDELVLLDIYPARELPIEGVNSDWLAEGIKTQVHRSDLLSFPDRLTDIQSDIYLTIGAGDIGFKVNEVKLKLEERE